MPVSGVAVAETSGASLTAAPAPTASNQLRFIRPPWSVGCLNTRNSSCVPVGGVIGTLTVVQFCQPPVLVIVGLVATSGPVGEPVRTSIVPPAPPDATRKRSARIFSRLTGLYET